MSQESIGISQEEYEQNLGRRIRPEQLRIEASYILRLLTPSHMRPPYAIEIFNKLVKIEASEEPSEGHFLYLECDRPPGTHLLPMSLTGHILANNTGPQRDKSLTEDFVEVGYLLSAENLDDVDLELFVTDKEPVS